MVDEGPDVVGEAGAEHDAAPIARDRSYVAPFRLVQDVDEIALLVRNFDPCDPHGVGMHVEGMIHAQGLHLPCLGIFRLRRPPGLTFPRSSGRPG